MLNADVNFGKSELQKQNAAYTEPNGVARFKNGPL
jgi:hypothetical protein